MDKKLSRQILFKQGKSVVESEVAKKPKKEKAAEVVATPKNQPSEQKKATSEDIYKWIQSRPLINLNGICGEVGVDRANFAKGMQKNRQLKEDVLNKFIEVLKVYGFSI